MRAVEHVLQMKRIEARGVLASRRLTAAMRREAIAAYRSHRRIELREMLRGEFAELLVDAMLVAHLRGVQAVRQSVPAVQFSIFGGTLAALARSMDYSLRGLRIAYGATVAKVIDQLGAYLDSNLNAAVERITRDGMHVREGIATLTKRFAELGVDPGGAHRVESLFRTQSATAYGAGRWQESQDPAVQEILWGYEYVTAGDDRVRPEHEALDGTRLPKEDPFWRRFWPPNGWNCRCVAIEIFHGDEEASPNRPPIETPQGTSVAPDEGFDFNAGVLAPAPPVF